MLPRLSPTYQPVVLLKLNITNSSFTNTIKVSLTCKLSWATMSSFLISSRTSASPQSDSLITASYLTFTSYFFTYGLLFSSSCSWFFLAAAETASGLVEVLVEPGSVLASGFLGAL